MRNIYLNKVPLEEAKEKYIKKFNSKTVASETVKVEKALNRVTAKPIRSTRSAPHFYASAMDGIAVKAENTAGASERYPVKLKAEKEAVWVDTGDPIPSGYNAVVKVEEINQKKDNILEIEKGVTPWENIRAIGESIVKEELILPKNYQISPYDIGGLLEAGLNRVEVRKRPEIGIIPTGSEIVPPDIEPQKGELPEFNSAMMKAYAEEWGGYGYVSEIIEDDYKTIKRKLKKQLKTNDITVIIAGSSAGEEDYTLKILQELGEVIVHGVNIMPGKPVILAEVEQKPVIGIPGYPLAALLNYNIFVKSLVYSLLGLTVPKIPQVKAKVKKKVTSHIGLKEFVRVNLAEIDNELTAVPRKRGSAAMKSLINADGIMPISQQKEGLKPGVKKNVYILKEKKKIRNNLLLMGSHDLSLDILRNHLQTQNKNYSLNFQSVGSLAGLISLKRRECHLAGSHLLDPESEQYNISYIKKHFPDRKMALLTLIHRKQGFIVKKGNPKNITDIDDFKQKDILFINRQRGSGTRVLFDYWLKKNNLSPADINGYDQEEYTHINAAAAVAHGRADTAMGILAAARALELDFVPLIKERYDLVLPAKLLDEPRIKMLQEIIKSKSFQSKVKKLGGYSTEASGQIIKLRERVGEGEK